MDRNDGPNGRDGRILQLFAGGSVGGLQLRAGDAASQSQVCSWLNRNADPKGRPSSDHIYAMWPSPIHDERPFGPTKRLSFHEGLLAKCLNPANAQKHAGED
jgi:hypothetical protein